MKVNSTIIFSKSVENTNLLKQNSNFQGTYSANKPFNAVYFGNKVSWNKKAIKNCGALLTSLSILLSGCSKASNNIDLKPLYSAKPKIAEMFKSPPENYVKLGKFYITKDMAKSPDEFEKIVNLKMKEFFNIDKNNTKLIKKYTTESFIGERRTGLSPSIDNEIKGKSLKYSSNDIYNKSEITETYEDVKPHIEWFKEKQIKDKKTNQIIDAEFSNATISVHGKLKDQTKKLLGERIY